MKKELTEHYMRTQLEALGEKDEVVCKYHDSDRSFYSKPTDEQMEKLMISEFTEKVLIGE